MLPSTFAAGEDGPDGPKPANPERTYRRVFDEAPVALYRTRPDGSILDANQALVRLLGYPDRETLGRVNAAEVYLDPAARLRWREQVDAGGDEVVFEMEDRRWDGTVIPIRDVAKSVRDAHGRILWYQGMLTPLDESLGHTAVHGIDEVGWSWSALTGRVSWTPSLRDAFGYDPSRPGPGIHQSYAWWLKRVHPEDRRTAALAQHGAALRGDSGWRTRYRFRRADGTWADVVEYGFAGHQRGEPVRLRASIREVPAASPANSGPDGVDISSPPVPPPDDRHLVAWSAQRDERAFDALWDRHRSRLLATLSRWTDGAEDAEELVTETFVQAWRSASSYDPDRGTVIAWLTSIARSRAYDRLRRRRRRRRLVKAAPKDPVLDHLQGRADEPSTEDRILRAQVLHEAFSELPAAQRTAIELAFLHGYSHREVARRLEVPVGTVKSRIRVGLRRLRSLMGGR